MFYFIFFYSKENICGPLDFLYKFSVYINIIIYIYSYGYIYVLPARGVSLKRKAVVTWIGIHRGWIHQWSHKRWTVGFRNAIRRRPFMYSFHHSATYILNVYNIYINAHHTRRMGFFWISYSNPMTQLSFTAEWW